MTIRALGDSAWLAAPAAAGLAAALAGNRPPGVTDVVASYDTLAVHFEGTDGMEIRDWIARAEPIAEAVAVGDEVEIPVLYGGEHGPDLEALARFAGLTEAEVVALHAGARYTVVAVGFSPGFPYLAGLPERLHMPRRVRPRLAVPAGSVAVAGGQAGIYPFATPGGWHLLGRTPARLFDPLAEPPALLKTGDRVRFVPVAALDEPEDSAPREIPGSGNVEVISPGALTTVQDLGRPGYQAHGVSPGGAVDRHALRLANLLLGNHDNAAALECCLTGPVLKFHSDTVVAVAGAVGKSRRVAAGETVDFTKIEGGARACIAFAGGLRVPEILGGAATDLRAGFGGHLGRALRAGDLLATGNAGRIPAPGDWHVGTPARRGPLELRFLAGVQADWFSKEARHRFVTERYRLTPDSDRMGARLAGAPLALTTPREMVSQPVACGSVQVPPDGQPIVLLAGRQTIGGYPQIGHVIAVDLPGLARLRPGGEVKFREVTLAEARALRREDERWFARLRTGLDLLKSAPCDSST